MKTGSKPGLGKHGLLHMLNITNDCKVRMGYITIKQNGPTPSRQLY